MNLRVPLLESKLHPPSLPPVVIQRRGFKDLIEKVCSRRLSRIVAPAGYGKSVFLSVFAGREDCRGMDGNGGWLPPVAWYTLEEMDGDAAVFLTHLTRSIDLALGNFGDDTRRTLFSVNDIERDTGIISATLVEELWNASAEREGKKGGLVIVLDDYHAVADSGAVNRVVDFLINNVPPDVHLCLAGRRRLPLKVERLTLRDQVFDVGPRELSFSREEIGELLATMGGRACAPENTGEIEAATDGWPAGVVLLAHSVRQGGEIKPGEAGGGQGREATFRYFAEEIFSLQSEEMRRFLVGAASLNYITPEACREVLGRRDAGRILEDALERGLFLSQVKTGGKRVYRFHQLFRSYLLNCREHHHTGVEIVELHRKAAGYYERVEMLDSAMSHCLEAGLENEAAGLLYRRGLEMIDRGYVDQLRHWLNRLPPALVEGSSRLLYYTGFVYQNSDPARALDCLDRAARGLAGKGETGLEVRALIYMATIYSLQNQVDRVKEAASRIPALEAIRKDPWSRGVLTVSALCQSAWEDSLTRGVWLGRIARRLPLDQDWYWAFLAYSCMIYYRLGDLDLSRRHIEEALGLPVVKNNDHWRGLALVLYHVVLYSQDDEENSHRVREDLWALGEKYNSAYFKAYAERARAFSRYHSGRLDQAREIFKSSLYFFEQAGNPAMASITRLDMALLDCQLGHAGEAVEEAGRVLGSMRSLNCGQGLEEMGESIFGAVAREAGQLDLAERHLLNSARISKRKGARQILAGTYLHLSRLYALRGQRRQADDYLSRALAIASRHRYRVFWDWHRPTLLHGCLRALEAGIHPEYAEYLLTWRIGREALGHLKALEESATGTRLARIRGIISRLEGDPGPGAEAPRARGPAVGVVEDALPEAAWPHIQIRLFGNLELLVNGAPVPEKAWQTRKAKTIFKYLVLNRGRRLTRDQLMELLWPEADPAAAAASLRVTLSRLRRALAQSGGMAQGKTPFFGDERGMIWFSPGSGYMLDIEEFEKKVNLGLGELRAGNAAAARKALDESVEIYRGDLLEEDLYEDWAISERERLQIIYLDALLTLARLHLEDTGGPEKLDRSRDLLLRAMAVTPYREDIYLALMEVYRAGGHAGEGLRLYERCRKMLAEEFGVEPGRAMKKLAGEIRTEKK